MKKLWKVLGLIGERKRYLRLLFFRIPVDFLLNLLQTLFLRDAFIAIEQGSSVNLQKACLFYGIGSVCLFTYNSIVWRFFAVMVAEIAGKIRIAAADSLISHSLMQVEKESSGDFLTKLNLDAGMTIMILGGPLNLPHFMLALINVLFNTILLFGTNISMAFVVFSFLIPHVILNYFVVTRPMKALQNQVLEQKSRMNTILASMVCMGDTIALYDAKSMLINSFNKASHMVLSIRMRMVFRNAIGSALIPLFGLSGYLVLLLFASDAISRGGMLFGEFTAITKLQGGVLMGLFMGIRSSVHIHMNMAGLDRTIKLLEQKK